MIKDKIIQIVEDYYANSYNDIHGSSNLKLADKVFHRALEEKHGKKDFFANVLELGSGNYEHLNYIKHSYDKYYCIDLRTPKIENPNPDKVVFLKEDVHNLSFKDESIDRIVATCILMHLDDPVKALEEWSRVLKPGGYIELMIPNEPGFLLTMFQRFFRSQMPEEKGYLLKRIV